MDASPKKATAGICSRAACSSARSAAGVAETDDDVLGIEGEVLGTRFIEELLVILG